MIEIVHENAIPVSFGDRDPAGIVYCPNHCRWFDATFRSPAVDGDRLDLVGRIVQWNARTFRLAYEGLIGGRLVVEGFEPHGVFIRDGGRLRAGVVAPLPAILEAGAARAAS